MEVITVANPTLDGNGRFTQRFGVFEWVAQAVVSGGGGYVGEIFGITGNVVTIQVRQSALLAHAGTAVDDHLAAAIQASAPPNAHAHDLVFEANPAANAVTMAANSLRNASAGALTVVGGGADGGIQDTTQTYAAGVVTTHTVTDPNDHVAGVLAAPGAGAIVGTFMIAAQGY